MPRKIKIHAFLSNILSLSYTCAAHQSITFAKCYWVFFPADDMVAVTLSFISADLVAPVRSLPLAHSLARLSPLARSLPAQFSSGRTSDGNQKHGRFGLRRTRNSYNLTQ